MGCRARVHERDGRVVSTLNEHDHAPDPARVEVVAAVGGMKRHAECTEEVTGVVVSSQLQSLQEESYAALPTMNALKQRIRRARQRIGKAPVNPTSSDSLVLPVEYTQYCPSPGVTENFLIFDSGMNGARMLVFGRPRAAEVRR